MIYIVEDDRNIQEIEIFALKNSGYQAVGFETAKEFYGALSEKLPELILLDIMLPDEDGVSILRRLRADKRYSNIPVIMATAKGSEFDKVKGLDSGADDYIAKPFGMLEMVARIKAVLRRCAAPRRDEDDEETIRIGRLEVKQMEHKVSVGGSEVVLTLKEYELLHLMLEHPMQVFTRDRLLSSIWGYEFDGESRTVDVHIRTLRQKLGPAGDLVETVRGVGYKISGKCA